MGISVRNVIKNKYIYFFTSLSPLAHFIESTQLVPILKLINLLVWTKWRLYRIYLLAMDQLRASSDMSICYHDNDHDENGLKNKKLLYDVVTYLIDISTVELSQITLWIVYPDLPVKLKFDYYYLVVLHPEYLWKKLLSRSYSVLLNLNSDSLRDLF